MPTEVAMPRLGWDMQVGSVAEWLKRDGDPVQEGEPIAMIAGDKATTELEAPGSGILRMSASSPEPGIEVPVGTLLAYLVAPGEEIPRESPAAAVAPQTVSSAPPTAALAVAETRDRSHRVVASPRARRAAAGLGVDWRTLTGSGRGGRILERDVVQASSAVEPPAPEPPELADQTELTDTDVVPLPLAGIRRLTAERMSLSSRTVAPVTLTTEANATALVRLRQQAAADPPQDAAVPGITDLLLKITAVALAEHPALNAELTDAGIVQHADINIGIAVDTPAGLLAPVVRGAGQRSVESIARESRRLVDAARTAASRTEDLTGGTFTISNLGMYEVDAFTPIVNLPQCAILGVGRIVARPVVLDEATEQVGVQRMLTLSLTFDHRLVDGAPAARFLQRIKHLVERPTLWLFR